MRLEDLKIYNLAMEIGDEVWAVCENWKYFAKDTIGKQLVRSADSIAANISEGFGRYHYKDSGRFYYIARGSLFETKTWLAKSHNRKLITKDKYEIMIQKLDQLGRMLNAYININKVNEPQTPYGSQADNNQNPTTNV